MVDPLFNLFLGVLKEFYEVSLGNQNESIDVVAVFVFDFDFFESCVFNLEDASFLVIRGTLKLDYFVLMIDVITFLYLIVLVLAFLEQITFKFCFRVVFLPLIEIEFLKNERIGLGILFLLKNS